MPQGDTTLLILINVLTVIGSIFASSGFWAWVNSRRQKKDSWTLLLMGLANDKIIYLSTMHIKKGFISHEEYRNLQEQLYEPYLALGGNGTAKKLMTEVSQLPMEEPTKEKK